MGFLKKTKVLAEANIEQIGAWRKRNGGETSRAFKEEAALLSLDDPITVEDMQLVDNLQVL